MNIFGVEITDRAMTPGQKYPMQKEFERRGIQMSARVFDEEVRRQKGVTSLAEDIASGKQPKASMAPLPKPTSPSSDN